MAMGGTKVAQVCVKLKAQQSNVTKNSKVILLLSRMTILFIFIQKKSIIFSRWKLEAYLRTGCALADALRRRCHGMNWHPAHAAYG